MKLDVSPRGKSLLFAVLLVALTLAAYLPALSGGFVWDDDAYVTGNAVLQDARGLSRIWLEPRSTPQYYPLVFTSFWLERRIWGLDPFGYHLVNVLLHAVNALLFWALLSALQVPGSRLAALIFALHPVHVESVAWITERKNVLSGLFSLAAFLSYLRFLGARDARAGDERGPEPRRAYVAALLLFGCALLSKTTASTLPAAILVVVWWRRGRLRWSDLSPLIPMFLLGAALGANTAYLERVHVGALGEEWDFSVLQRSLIAGMATWFYAAKLLWPIPTMFVYPRWEIPAGFTGNHLFVAAAAGVPPALWLLRHRIGRGPLAAALLFGGTLVPALGFFNLYPMRYSFVADHFQYLASLGPIALFSGGCAVLAEKHSRSLARARLPLAAVLVGALGLLSWRQAHDYRDYETLWRNTLAKNPAALIAHYNLANELERQGRLDEAAKSYRDAVRLKPELADAHYNLARTLAALGRTGESIARYREVLRLQGGAADAMNDLAWLLATHPEASFRDGAEAVRLAERASAIGEHRDPAFLDTLAAAYAEAGRFADAVQAAERAEFLARSAGDEAQVAAVAGRLAGYRSDSPFRDASLSGGATAHGRGAARE